MAAATPTINVQIGFPRNPGTWAPSPPLLELKPLSCQLAFYAVFGSFFRWRWCWLITKPPGAVHNLYIGTRLQWRVRDTPQLTAAAATAVSALGTCSTCSLAAADTSVTLPPVAPAIWPS
eukprot:CAMPEP_0172819064 /NCGR_PEP_ID=MMETSP1075-20121228/14333_1 /TAXON_ID=2916 /ORGANISM="Ceratium fusus, Strain PA161109" /LENGTH=119 /DNA_ID=CAMNT_0013659519 /DNA_START=165 /DNA_END=524 /DNA_ORIENTATION=+